MPVQVLASPGQGSIGIADVALGGLSCPALRAILSRQRGEHRFQPEFHIAEAFERAEGVLVADQRLLAAGDGGLRLVQKGAEGSDGGIEVLRIREGLRHGSDGSGEFLAECIEVGLGGEDGIRLRVCHGQRALSGIQRRGSAGGIGVEMRLGRLQRCTSGLEQRSGALRIVLEGSEHGTGIETRDARQLFLRALQVSEFLDEALTGIGDLGGER